MTKSKRCWTLFKDVTAFLIGLCYFIVTLLAALVVVVIALGFTYFVEITFAVIAIHFAIKHW